MSLVLNTNVNAINSQNALNKSQMSLSQAMQRLSSGLRINSAADDAAGLAIATRMTTQVNGLTQGSQNANDGISLAQTAEGALSELNNNLQAIRTLAVESANATNSDSDRAAIDQEVQQRLQEVDRIATQTTFNGQHVLDGTLGSATFQVGANVGETIGISLNTSMKTTSIGSLAQTATTASVASLFQTGTPGLTLAAGGLTVNGTSVAAGNYTTDAGLTAAINTAWTTSGGTGTLATVSGNEIAFSNATGAAVTFGGTQNPLGINSVAAATTVAPGLNLAAGGFTVNGTNVAAGNYTTSAALTAAINTAAGSTIATVSGNEIALSNATNSAITFGGTQNPMGITTLAAQAVVPAGLNLAAGGLSVNGTNVAAGNYTTASALAVAINAASTTAGIGSIATVTGNEINITNSSGTAITLAGTQRATLGVAASVAPAGLNLAAGDLVVNGTNVAAGNYTTSTALTAAINTAWTTSGGSGTLATVSGNEIAIDNSDTAHAANFTGSAAAGLGLGTNAAATPAGVTLASGDFTIGGTNITGTFANLNALVSAINTAAITGITATNNAGQLELANSTGSGVAVGGTFATTLGIGATVAAGGNESSTAAVTAIPAQVDSTSTSTGVHTAETAATVVASTGVHTAETAAGSSTPTAATSTGVHTAETAAGSTTAGVATSTGVNAAVTSTGNVATPLTLATGDLTIKLGTGAAIDMAGTYDTSQDLADAINSKVSGMYASISATGNLSLSAADAITVAGAKAGAGTGDFGFATTGAAIAVAGSLRGTDVLTVDDSNNMIQRIDSALTAVNNYNSVLGAIQNRFQSTINSASAAAQNITAARSRIQDADFASETTKMTSANILQQAGVSVLAQANSSQQSILKLLQ